MKFLFDQNLSPRLVQRLADVYPDSTHVATCGLDRAPDRDVWVYTRDHGYTIISRDADFSEMSLLRSFPPDVVWIRRGNCTTADIEALLRRAVLSIQALAPDTTTGILVLT